MFKIFPKNITDFSLSNYGFSVILPRNQPTRKRTGRAKCDANALSLRRLRAAKIGFSFRTAKKNQLKMTKDKVTRNDLRNITPGKTEIFVLPSAKHCQSARTMASWLNRFEGIPFSTSIDCENRTISITRLLKNEQA